MPYEEKFEPSIFDGKQWKIFFENLLKNSICEFQVATLSNRSFDECVIVGAIPNQGVTMEKQYFPVATG